MRRYVTRTLSVTISAKILIILLLLGAFVAAGASVALLAIPGEDGTIQGCFVDHANAKESQGQLRIVSDPSKCRNNEIPISWNQDGPQGPPGPPGPAPSPSVMQLAGPLVATTPGTGAAPATSLNFLFFPVELASGAQPIDLTPGELNIKYTDAAQSITMTTTNQFTTFPISGGDSDLILEQGEFAAIRLLNLVDQLDPDLGADTTFSIDVVSRLGTVLTIERTTPTTLPGGGLDFILP